MSCGGWASRSRWSAAGAPTRPSWSRASRAATVLPIDEIVLLDLDPDRLEIVGGLAGRILGGRAGPGGWPHRRPVRRPRRAPTRSSSCASAARRHASSTRRCRSGSARIGQETTGPGGFAKALRTVPVVLEIAEEPRPARRARRLDRRLHEPGRDRDPGAARRGPSRHRAVQRRDRVPAPVGPHFGVAPERVALDHVGLNHLSWIRPSGSTASTGCPSCWTPTTRRMTLGGDFPLEVVRALARDPLLLPPLLLRDRRVLREQRDGASRGTDVIGDRAASSWTCTGTRRWTTSRSCSSAAAARTTARRPRPADRVAAHGRRRRPGRRHPERGRHPQPARRRGGGGAGAHRSRRRHAHRDRPARAGDARAGATREGVRSAGDRGGAERSDREVAPPGAGGQPARSGPRWPLHSSTRSSMRTVPTCRASFPGASAPVRRPRACDAGCRHVHSEHQNGRFGPSRPAWASEAASN